MLSLSTDGSHRTMSLTERMSAMAQEHAAAVKSADSSRHSELGIGTDKLHLLNPTPGVTALLAPALTNGHSSKMDEEFEPFPHFGT